MKTIFEKIGDFNGINSAETEEVIKRLLIEFAPIVPSELSDRELQHLNGLGTAIVAASKEESERRRGWERRSWGRGGPSIKGRVLDHHYRLVNEEEGRTVYVSEPYEVNSDIWPEIQKAIDEGWSVVIRGNSSYYPGEALRITFERESQESNEEKPTQRYIP